jgi:hypothetical protein
MFGASREGLARTMPGHVEIVQSEISPQFHHSLEQRGLYSTQLTNQHADFLFVGKFIELFRCWMLLAF